MAAGLFVPVSLPPGIDEERAARALSAVESLPTRVAELIVPRATGLALGFAAAPEPTLRQAVGELRERF